MTKTSMARAMVRALSFCVMVGAILALSGCGGINLQRTSSITRGMKLQQLSAISPTGSQFNHALFKDYLSLAQHEYVEGDGGNSDVFAKRARVAGEGKDVDPEQIGARHLSSNYKFELTSARTRLIKALDGGARDKAPIESARAQTMFDCWMEEAEEENGQPEGKGSYTPDNDLASCRSGFFTALGKIEAKPKVAAQPAHSVRRSYRVFFDWDKSNIRTDARKVLKAASSAYKSGVFVKITLTGYADRSGPKAYNLRLSIRRAEAVKAVLVKLGIEAKNITIIGRGEADPLVPTADGVREPRNRRVQIMF